MLVSHDADFAPQMRALAEDRTRRVALVGFQEFFATELRAVPGIEMFDLEHDAGAFMKALPRVRIIDIDTFDPYEFL